MTRNRQGRPLLLLALLMWVLTACGSSVAGDSVGASRPQVVMTDAESGVAVWPSGARWIVLATTDGWRTVENRTPLAVPTDGGLVLSARSHDVAVGVLPHQLLTVSPVLRSSGSGSAWTPSQLPGGLLAAPAAIALSGSATWAVLDQHGEVVTEPAGAETWHHSTSSRELDATGGWNVTGISSPDGTIGFIMGTGPARGHVLFMSTTDGRSWQPVPLPLVTDGTATALAPCRIGGGWVAPVVVADRLQLFSAHDLGGPWVGGPSVPTPSSPVVACGQDTVWAAVPTGTNDDLMVASAAGGWSRIGDLGMRIVTLSVTSPTHAYAASDDPAAMISITLSSGVTTERIQLPSWVATLGGAEMRN